MTLKNIAVTFVLGSMALVTVGATSMRAQSHVNSVDPSLGAPSVATEESHIGGMTGHAEEGKLSIVAIVLAAMGRTVTARA